MTYYFDDIASVFCFGKHKGDTLWSVIQEDESYVYWCVNNIPNFIISIETLKQIRSIFPMFIITSNFLSHILDYRNQEDNEEYEYDEVYEDNRCYDNEEKPTYERYQGSWAQDEMGYSDDDIDTIFDGDPLAYWNID